MAVELQRKDVAAAMKGLLFNLLERHGRRANCSKETWSVLADFAAAEARLAGNQAHSPRDVVARGAFEVTAEAMVRCFPAENEH